MASSISSLILLILGNTQFVVTFLTIISILHLHSAHSAWFAIGTLVAAFSAKLLKKCIKQPRPIGATKYTKTYGMPSTHSSSISFFGTYLSLSTLLLPIHPRLYSILPFWKYFDSNPSSSSLSSSLRIGIKGERIVRFIIAIGWIGGAGSVCWSRIKLGHHTIKQVLVGAILGSLVALVWLTLWLGLEEVSTLLNLPPFWENIIGNGNEGIPQLILGGMKEIGEVWEVAAEDTVWLLLEAWKEGRWDKLKGVKGFPLFILVGGKDEL